MPKRSIVVKRKNASTLFTNFLISFAISVVGTRLFLHLTGYPQIATDIYHLAHLLWGGIALALAVVLLILYRGKVTLHVAAILGGFGWGLFIDEVGKFITVNNDYHFRPAAVVIYVLFLIAFIVMLYLKKDQKESIKTRLYDSLEGLEEIVEHDLDPRERRRLEEQLEGVIEDSQDKNITNLAKQILKFVQTQEVTPPENDIFSTFKKLKHSWGAILHQIPQKYMVLAFRLILMVKIFGSFSWVAVQAAYSVGISIDYSFLQGYANQFMVDPAMDSLFFFAMNITRLLISLLLITMLSEPKKDSIKIITISLWISLAFVDVFDFYYNQFAAVIATVFDVALLSFIRDYASTIVNFNSSPEKD